MILQINLYNEQKDFRNLIHYFILASSIIFKEKALICQAAFLGNSLQLSGIANSDDKNTLTASEHGYITSEIFLTPGAMKSHGSKTDGFSPHLCPIIPEWDDTGQPRGTNLPCIFPSVFQSAYDFFHLRTSQYDISRSLKIRSQCDYVNLVFKLNHKYEIRFFYVL